MLDFLRAFAAIIRSNRKDVTQCKEDEGIQSIRKSLSIDPKSIYIALPLKKWKKIRTRKVSYYWTRKNSNFYFNDQIKNQEEIKKRKQESINGTKSLLKGVYIGNISSNYQDLYMYLHIIY